MKKLVNLVINKKPYKVEVEPYWTLLRVLRENLMLTGTKCGCDTGECGACTVLVEGRPVLSCLILAISMDGKEILTIEGLEQNGKLDMLQEIFIKHGAMQCGYCIPGMIMTLKGLFDKKPIPNETEIKEALAENLCRCGTYPKILKAALDYVETRKQCSS
jgi:carbon-monoxide dehydrogenase small subunit